MQITTEFLRQWANRQMDNGNARLAHAIEIVAAELNEMPDDFVGEIVGAYNYARVQVPRGEGQ